LFKTKIPSETVSDVGHFGSFRHWLENRTDKDILHQRAGNAYYKLYVIISAISFFYAKQLALLMSVESTAVAFILL
jgi:hypothetical protein